MSENTSDKSSFGKAAFDAFTNPWNYAGTLTSSTVEKLKEPFKKIAQDMHTLGKMGEEQRNIKWKEMVGAGYEASKAIRDDLQKLRGQLSEQGKTIADRVIRDIDRFEPALRKIEQSSRARISDLNGCGKMLGNAIAGAQLLNGMYNNDTYEVAKNLLGIIGGAVAGAVASVIGASAGTAIAVGFAVGVLADFFWDTFFCEPFWD